MLFENTLIQINQKGKQRKLNTWKDAYSLNTQKNKKGETLYRTYDIVFSSFFNKHGHQHCSKGQRTITHIYHFCFFFLSVNKRLITRVLIV